MIKNNGTGRKKKIWITVTAALLILAAVFTLFRVKEDEQITYLFIGDSFASRLESYGYQTECLTIWAVTGYSAADLKKEINNMPSGDYDRIVLMVGINTIDEMVGEIQIDDEVLLITKLQERYGAPIYVQKVFPVAESLSYTHEMLTLENIAEYNRLLEEYCAATEGVFFFDATDGFVDENGYLTCTEDGLHIAGEYMDKYYENVITAIKEAG